LQLFFSCKKPKGDKTGVAFVDGLPENHPMVIFMTSLPAHHELTQSAQRRAPVLTKPFTQAQLGQLLQGSDI